MGHIYKTEKFTDINFIYHLINVIINYIYPFIFPE